MADDKRIDLGIGVGAEYVEGSAENAVNKTFKEVDSSVKKKGGRVTVPVDINVAIDEKNDKLTKAQKTVTDKINKMTAKGFSASGKDVDDLKSKFNAFAKTLDQAGKGRQNKIFREIRSQVEAIEKSYASMMKSIRTEDAKVKTKNNSSDYIKRKASDYQKRREAQKRRQQEEIDNAIDIHNREIQNKELAGKGPNRLGSTPPYEYKEHAIDAGRTSELMMQLSKYSAHGSKWASDLAKTLEEEIAKSIKSLVTYVDEDLASKELFEQTRTETTRNIKFKKKNELGQLVPEDEKVVTEHNIEKAGTPTTDKKFLTDVFNKALDDFTKLLRQQEKGDVSLTDKDYIDLLSIIRTIDETRENDLEHTYEAIKRALLRPYSNSSSDRMGGTNAEEGAIKGEGKGHELATETIKKVYNFMNQLWEATNPLEAMAKRFYQASQEVNSTSAKTEKKRRGRPRKNSQYEEYAATVSSSDEAKAIKDLANQVRSSGEKTAQEVAKTTKAVDTTNKTTETQMSYDKVENVSERQADVQLEAEQQATTQANEIEAEEIKEDSGSGFNTDDKANKLLKEQSELKKILGKEVKGVLEKLSNNLFGDNSKFGLSTDVKTNLEDAMCPCQDILSQIAQGIKNIDVSVGNILQGLLSMGAKLPNNLPALIEGENVKDHPVEKELDKTNHNKLYEQKLNADIEKDRNTKFVHEAVEKYRKERAEKQEMYEKLFGKNGILDTWGISKTGQNGMTQSKITTSPFQYTDSTILRAMKRAFGTDDTRRNAKQISAMTQSEQEQLRANRIERFGLSRSNRETDTGDIAQVYRTRRNFGWGKNIENPFKDLNLTEGINLDTTAITEALQNAIQKNMFEAQTGGWFKNLIGPLTLYAGQPSLEKSRAEADAANQVMAEIRQTVQNILNDILAKETDLRGMEKSGKAVFENGQLVQDNSKNGAATKLFADLESDKMALQGVLADVGMVNEVVEQTGGNVTKIMQQLGFAAPELRKCNTILQNVNAGLDKNGKALKFQTRSAEVLNYSFQLMARSIGQMIKRWLSMLNPVNLLKKAFQDFASYDVKWQRTMNVIKYNIRRIIKPAMQWIAQQIVNMIGLVNALLKGIGKVFGQNWDLFDQSAANTEKMAEDFERINNVTASFDELHDIGSEINASDPAMDLMGDIYTPQWDGLYKVLEDIGEVIGKIINAVSGWSFWQWLALAGAALLGFLALKWLIGLFKGRNPLENIANGFSFLEKAVGWALLIWAFTEFTKAITDFVECMKTADWEDISKSLIMLGSAFALLFAGIAGIQGITKFLGVTTGELFGMSALVGVFGLFVKAIIPFVELMARIKKEFPDEADQFEVLAGSLSMLALAFVDLIGGVAGIEGITKLIGLDWTSLLGLSVVVGALDAFVAALVPFIEVMSQIPDGKMIDVIVGSFFELIGAFIALAAGVGAISRAFKTMDWSAIGQLAAITVVFDLFMMTLIPFVHAIKDVPFETLAGGTVLIAGAFLALGGAVALMAPALKMLDWSSLAKGLVLMLAMAGIVWVLNEFVHALKDLTSEQIAMGLALLAGGLAAVTLAITALITVLSVAIGSGVGALAILALAGLLAVMALVIASLAEFVRALGEAGEGIKLICEGIVEVVTAIGNAIAQYVTAFGAMLVSIISAIAIGISTVITTIGQTIATIITSIADAIINIINGIVIAFTVVGQTISLIVETIAQAISTTIEAIANGIVTVLTPILEFIDSIIGKIMELAGTIVHEIGETIRTVVQTVGDVILGIINGIMNAIPNLLGAILNFINNLGPAIERCANSIMNTVTRIVNFIVSAVEYIINLAVDGVNGVINAVNSVSQYAGIHLPTAQRVSIARFVPRYEKGTNYVPNDGLAYLHQGEAVVPKKYNTPYQPDNSGMVNAIDRLTQQVEQISNKVDEGIPVNGQFVQRGSDLVATVQRVNNKMSNNILNNKVFAR